MWALGSGIAARLPLAGPQETSYLWPVPAVHNSLLNGDVVLFYDVPAW
jgi:hypothetical protein